MDKVLSILDRQTVLMKTIAEIRSAGTDASAINAGQQVQINNTNYFNKCSFNVISGNLYDRLEEKIGKMRSLQFIASKDTLKNPLAIFQRACLDDLEPNEYPIAYNGKEFRYLDDNGDMVCDRSGERVRKLISAKVSDVLIKTSEILLKECDNDYDRLFEDLGTLQDKAANPRISTSALKRLLEIKDHPFFS